MVLSTLTSQEGWLKCSQRDGAGHANVFSAWLSQVVCARVCERGGAGWTGHANMTRLLI
jgi:hypothetical protein